MNVRHLTFRLLQVYVAVVRLGSVSRAAAQLHLTQPTVSQQLKRLAEAVGEPLLDSQMKPTFIGTELYHAAFDALSRFDDFGGFLKDARQGTRGSFSIGVVTTAKYILPRLLGPFNRQFPGVEVSISVGNRGYILERHRHQQDDVYLFSHPPTGEHTLSGRFIHNPLVMITPPDHWAVKKPPVNFAELLNERFLLREPGSATRLVFEEWLRSRNLQLKRVMQIESNEVIRMSVEQGLGLAVLSEHTLAEGEHRLGRPVLTEFPLGSYWYLVCHGNRRLPYPAANFVHFVNEHLARCVDERYIHNDLAALLGHIGSDAPYLSP
ncbi:LysR family transcriptional regulator [Oceanimonas baumannii]|uniref:DNA-binding transcriptional LysR family regulator n=1 Tax=Oceanimonas baumannii TaxID=129578 RepID=A0A235CMQ6_9GAMM|nr:LysR family transcriptional regulator [Oceanimonas baumannii]OYD25307.1 LysR family transcriptional regulator [Oceanimonas baumannii]TDW62395.1 DNA-binding transcriptional LysR family regulator [Oceanimonas baumannii]